MSEVWLSFVIKYVKVIANAPAKAMQGRRVCGVGAPQINTKPNKERNTPMTKLYISIDTHKEKNVIGIAFEGKS